MHEWALAEAIISSVRGFAGTKKLKRVSEINLLFGEMQNVDEDIFWSAVSEIVEGDEMFRDLRVRIGREKTLLRCNSCGKEWEFSAKEGGMGEDELEAVHFVPEVSQVYMKCPGCGSRDFEILKGRGIRIKSVRGE